MFSEDKVSNEGIQQWQRANKARKEFEYRRELELNPLLAYTDSQLEAELQRRKNKLKNSKL